MSLKINDTKFTGRITHEVEPKPIPGKDRNVLEFQVAIDDSYYDAKAEKTVERTQFIPCRIYGPRGDALAKNAPKGKLLYFEGKVTCDQWEDKESKQKRSRVVIEVHEWQFAEAPRAERATVGAGAEG